MYILDIFGEILWLRVPSNGQECEKNPGRCYARTSEKFSKYGQYIQSTPLNRATSVRGHFASIKRRTLLTENILY